MAEYSTKLCPFMSRPMVAGGTIGNYNVLCRQEKCMAWRQYNSEDETRGGWCVLLKERF